jgi:Glycosyl hydrolases related to GH101 family, GH129
MNRITLCALVVVGLIAPTAQAADDNALPSIENDALCVSLLKQDALLTVMDKRIGLVWRQRVAPGFQVVAASVKQTPGRLSAKVTGQGGPYSLTISLAPDHPHGFDLALDIPGREYTAPPPYPFPFAAPQDGEWFYVQNTTGEGMLMPLAKPDEIKDIYQWNGGQPWWGLTDLARGMSARLDSFRSQAARATVYAMPLRIHYDFFTDGGYQRLAKAYREHFLRSNPEMKKLAERVHSRPVVASLKDAVYVYLWGDSPAEDLQLVREMKAAGVERGIGVFYGRHEIDRALFDGIKQLGWRAGMYKMPTGNLFQVSRRRGWPTDVLLGRVAPDRLLADSNRAGWDRICAKHLLPEWTEKAKDYIRDYGTQLFYFDTTVVQLAPCLSPDHPSTIEENQEARRAIMRATRDLGMLVGSGEGNSPTWALPELDFFEGLMSIRTYIDTPLSVPGGDYAKDLGDSEQEHVTLDQTRRIPLYQLAFHDYVAGTWVWRDTNFQSAKFAWKKELFNVLYGTMPMWHIDRKLWDLHKKEMLASYQRIHAVRERIGFAEMINHGWLTTDRSVQFTDWDTGDRVIMNFGDRPFALAGGENVAARSFVMRKVKP